MMRTTLAQAFPVVGRIPPYATAIASSPDEALAIRYPDLMMQWRDPAPARQAHDLLAKDADNYHISGGINQAFARLVAVDMQNYIRLAQCMHDLGYELDQAYGRSPTFRRLFNYWEIALRNGQLLLLCAAPVDAPSPGDAMADRHRFDRLSVAPRTPTGWTSDSYASEQGPTQLEWSRYCMQRVVAALIRQPLGDPDGHARGATIEYTNIVLKERGCISAAQMRCDAPAIPVRPERPRPFHPTAETFLDSSKEALRVLDGHLALTEQYRTQGLVPGATLLARDKVAMPYVIRSENNRLADLNLSLHCSVISVIDLVGSLVPPFQQRIIFARSAKSPNHFYADVQADSFAALSVLITDPASHDENANQPLYRQICAELWTLGRYADLHIGAVSIGVQRATADSLIFCMAFAQASHENGDAMRRLHGSNRACAPLKMPGLRPRHLPTHALGINPIRTKLLPADFFKHACYRKSLTRYATERDDAPGKNVLMRKLSMIALSMHHINRSYQPSIEYKRRHLLISGILAYMPHDPP